MPIPDSATRNRHCFAGNLPDNSKRAPQTTFLSTLCCTDEVNYAIFNFYLLNVNRNGYSGLNVEPENPEALAKAIMKITSSEEAYRTYSRQARAHYNKMFVKERMLAGYEQVYASLYHEK